MGLDNILLHGDKVKFKKEFGMAQVEVRPVTIKGSGPAKVKGKRICVLGDEGSVIVPACKYKAGPFSKEGLGIVTIKAVGASHKSSITKVSGSKLLRRGQKFIAEFTVLVMAQTPPPLNMPDPTMKYIGQGWFEGSNSTHRSK